MIYVLELESLAVDEDGWLWCKMEWAPDVELGVLEREPDVPAGLAGELAQLLDQWRDTQAAGDERDEWRATYRQQSGV